MTKVFVVMGNDFPDAVFDNKTTAEEYCSLKSRGAHKHARRIYWRVYEFTLNQGE
jgi:hypothetical protein